MIILEKEFQTIKLGIENTRRFLTDETKKDLYSRTEDANNA
jgi:hypothetical protein